MHIHELFTLRRLVSLDFLRFVMAITIAVEVTLNRLTSLLTTETLD